MNNEILFLSAALVVITVVYVFYYLRGDDLGGEDATSTFSLTCTRLAFLERAASEKYEEMIWSAPTHVTFISVNGATLLACGESPLRVPSLVSFADAYLLAVDADKLPSASRESIAKQLRQAPSDRYLLDGENRAFGVALIPEYGEAEYAVTRLTDRLFRFHLGEPAPIQGTSAESSPAPAAS